MPVHPPSARAGPTSSALCGDVTAAARSFYEHSRVYLAAVASVQWALGARVRRASELLRRPSQRSAALVWLAPRLTIIITASPRSRSPSPKHQVGKQTLRGRLQGRYGAQSPALALTTAGSTRFTRAIAASSWSWLRVFSARKRCGSRIWMIW